jgi:4-diphosphocytidyl-2-C-methyl-D-erythritol kinase
VTDHISLSAPAKLNLSLNILPGKGERGYYRVRFVNTQVTLADFVELRRTEAPFLSIDQGAVDGKENIALRAARLMFDSFQLPGGITIGLRKRIPSRAGLGGGSADAASVINGIDELFGLGIDVGEKLRLAGYLGMDVCYCIVGGLAQIEGIGDEVRPLPHTLPELNVLIATPMAKKISTEWAYSILDPREIGKGLSKHQPLLEAIARRDVGKIASNLHNDFEGPVGRRFPVTVRIRERMREGGALNAALAGSGLSVFGIFENRKSAEKARDRLEKEGHECQVVKTL